MNLERPTAPVETLLETVEREVLAAARLIYFFLGAPPFLILLPMAFVNHTATPWLVLEMLGMVILGASLGFSSLPHATRKLGATLGLTLAAMMALFHFGPLIGTGLLFMLAALLGSIFFGRRGAIATSVSLVGSFGLFLAASFKGIVHPPPPDLASLDALRLGLSTTLVLTSASVIFWRMRVALRRAVGAEVAARDAERAAQDERVRLLHSAETTQRLESLGRLAGGVAHEFNNVLVAIQGGAAMVALAESDGERTGYLEEINAGVARAAAISRRLLALSRKNADVGECEPRSVLLDLSERMALPRTIQLTTDLPPATTNALVALRPGALEEVVQHLVKNAVEAMPRGGTLTLGVDVVPASGTVEIRVTDTGAGMTDEVKERIFEPFFTTKGSRSAGLGLAAVWATAHAAGGEIIVDSVRNRGTTMTLRLPAPAVAAPVPETAVRSGAVLIVDDDDAVLLMLDRILSRAGYVVSRADSVAAAVVVLESGRFDLLITDGILGDGGAADVIQAFRRSHAEQPIIVCSGYVEEDLALSGVRRGDWGFLRKPFKSEELLSLVARFVVSPASAQGQCEPPAAVAP